jgi:hypothetical protein
MRHRPVQHADISDASGSPTEFPVEAQQKNWQIRLRRLEERICELLITNHQLRMALMESKAMVPEDGDGLNL